MAHRPEHPAATPRHRLVTQNVEGAQGQFIRRAHITGYCEVQTAVLPAAGIEVAIPKLRQGAYFPEWLLERCSRAEQAAHLINVGPPKL